jgi:hypothetical protein
LAIVIRLAIVLSLLLAASLFWMSYHNHAASAVSEKAPIASPSLMPEDVVHMDASAGDGFNNAQSAIVFSTAPLTSLSAITPGIDSDPVASFRELIALPRDASRENAHIDPRRMRTIFDRGVVTYASAKNDDDRAGGVRLIQAVALVGFSPARALLARNYPQSEAVRSVIPASDVIRYALEPVMDLGTENEDAKQIFLGLEQHFALRGQLDLFATQILNSLRGDSRPQLAPRLDTLLDLLARARGACGALARSLLAASESASHECSFSEKLRAYIETTGPSAEQEELKRRGLLLLNQLEGG